MAFNTPDDCPWDSDLDYASAAGLLHDDEPAAPMTDETREILANMLRWYEEIQDV